MYKLTYTGQADHLQIGLVICKKNKPVFIDDDSLPLRAHELKQLKDLKVEKGKFDDVSSKVLIQMNDAAKQIVGNAKPTIGVMWKGNTLTIKNEFGLFIKNVPRTDLTQEQIELLVKRSSDFIKI